MGIAQSISQLLQAYGPVCLDHNSYSDSNSDIDSASDVASVHVHVH
jgi:hypothetical protein